MRIAIVKPDYEITGGFELVMQRVALELAARGHEVTWVAPRVAALPRRAYGIAIPDDMWQAQPEYFRYAVLADTFAHLDPGPVDLVISTQPPSFAVAHPRHLALFSHHLRIYYDLSDVYVASGLAANTELHEAAAAAVRRIDDHHFSRPGLILAASEIVRDRLLTFNGLAESCVGVYHAGVGVPEGVSHLDTTRFEHPLCVSRHEFPKRTELFVQAMKLLGGTTGIVVGGGGRLPYVRALDAAFTRGDLDPATVDSASLWMRTHEGAAEVDPDSGSGVRFEGHVSDAELAQRYASALCVVAPAYLEDYGLTAIEAMHYGKPLIVCRDGGGLTLFVQDGVNGFVVEPTGHAIADAIRRLRDDPQLARTMGQAARETAATYSWRRAMDEIGAGIDLVMS